MDKISDHLLRALSVDGEFPQNVHRLDPEASTRKYYSVCYKNTKRVLCIDENFHQSSENFIKIQEFLFKNNFSVPEIVKILREEKAILLSDEGSIDLSVIQNEEEFCCRVREAIDILSKLQVLSPIELISSRSFDDEKLRFELNFLLNAYNNFQSTHGFEYSFGSGIVKILKGVNRKLAKYTNKVICHRDFHSRNLLINSKGKISMIDFQDMMMGTPQYDLVSILYDAYRPVSKKFRIDCLNYFLSLTQQRNDFEEVFFSQALQRSFKALGTYIFQFNEKGKIKYKQSILNCLDNLEEITESDLFPNLLSEFVVGLKSSLENSEIFCN